MDTAKAKSVPLTWGPRHELLLSAIAELGEAVPMEQILARLSATEEYTTKGPKETKLNPPEYYLGQVIRLLTSEKLVQRKKNVLRLTEKGRERVRGANAELDAHGDRTVNALSVTADVRTVDAKSRLLLPKEFANATVTVERVSETEIRVRKAVVIPEDALPLMEDTFKPLSDRDRDFFLQLLDNPPEPTPAFLKAAASYKKNYG